MADNESEANNEINENNRDYHNEQEQDSGRPEGTQGNTGQDENISSRSYDFCSYIVEKTRRLIHTLALEVFMLLLGFGDSIQICLEENLICHTFCLKEMNLTSEMCSKPLTELSSLEHMEETVHHATNHKLVIAILEFVVAAFSSLFLCPWSDSHGVKLTLTIPLYGMILQCVIFHLIEVFLPIHIGAYIAINLLSSLFGGSITVTSMVYSYASSHSSISRRLLKFALADSFYVAGKVFGNFLFTRYHLLDLRYIHDLNVLTVSRVIAMCWAIIAFKSTRTDSQSSKRCDLCSLENVKKCFSSLKKRRKNCGKDQLFFLLLAMIPIILAYGPVEGMQYFDTGHSTEFPTSRQYVDVSMFMALFGALFVPFAVWIKGLLYDQGDPVLGIVGTVSLMAAQLGKSVSSHGLSYRSALSLVPFSGMAPAAARSRYSKISRKDEYGKLFVFLGIIEGTHKFAGFFVYVKIFEWTKDMILIIPYMLVANLLVIPLSVFIWQLLLMDDREVFGNPAAPIEDRTDRTSRLESIPESEEPNVTN